MFAQFKTQTCKNVWHLCTCVCTDRGWIQDLIRYKHILCHCAVSPAPCVANFQRTPLYDLASYSAYHT